MLIALDVGTWNGKVEFGKRTGKKRLRLGRCTDRVKEGLETLMPEKGKEETPTSIPKISN